MKLAAYVVSFIASTLPFAQGSWLTQGARNTAKTVHRAVKDTGAEWDRGRRRTGKVLTKAREDTGTALTKGRQDFAAALTKAREDSVNEVIRSPKNLDRARLTIQRFAYRETQGLGDTLTDAERRVRQGKFADAIWHLATDPLKHTEENTARMTQESSIIRGMGQIVATAYGGAGGAAAYAAWYTYRETKNPELALRVGLITGATSVAMSEVGKIPTKHLDAAGNTVISVSAVTRKVAVAGAIGGLAVAASGGDKRALRDGFLYSGGTILVQDIYENATNHKLDARSSKGEAYAMSSRWDEPEGPPIEAFYDDNGNPILDKNGRLTPDVRRTDPRRPHVGRWSTAADVKPWSERSVPMTAVSRIPGMNAMALFHDQCAVYFDMNALTSVGTIAPATVFTYIGTGTNMYDLIQRTASMKENELRRQVAVQNDGQRGAPDANRPAGRVTNSSSDDEAYAEEAGAVIRGLDLDGKSRSTLSHDRNVASRWVAGARHATYEHVFAGDERDSWLPDPGYEWIDPGDSEDLSVRWAPGLRHLKYQHLVASRTEGRWIVDNEYESAQPQ